MIGRLPPSQKKVQVTFIQVAVNIRLRRLVRVVCRLYFTITIRTPRRVRPAPCMRRDRSEPVRRTRRTNTRALLTRVGTTAPSDRVSGDERVHSSDQSFERRRSTTIRRRLLRVIGGTENVTKGHYTMSPAAQYAYTFIQVYDVYV